MDNSTLHYAYDIPNKQIRSVSIKRFRLTEEGEVQNRNLPRAWAKIKEGTLRSKSGNYFLPISKADRAELKRTSAIKRLESIIW